MNGQNAHLRPRGAIRWSTLIFILVFTALAMVVAFYFLMPGLEVASEVAKDPKRYTPQEQRTVQAWYRLLLFVLLFILFAGVVLTFRFGRFFFPRAATPRTQTQYIDAWAESARRMQVPDADEDEDEDEDEEGEGGEKNAE